MKLEFLDSVPTHGIAQDMERTPLGMWVHQWDHDHLSPMDWSRWCFCWAIQCTDPKPTYIWSLWSCASEERMSCGMYLHRCKAFKLTSTLQIQLYNTWQLFYWQHPPHKSPDTFTALEQSRSQEALQHLRQERFSLQPSRTQMSCAWQLAAVKAEGFACTVKKKQESLPQVTCSQESMQAALRHCTLQPQWALKPLNTHQKCCCSEATGHISCTKWLSTLFVATELSLHVVRAR